MPDTDALLADFFARYESRMNRALADPSDVDVGGTVAAFAPCFVEASPAGIVCSANDDDFRAAVPKGIDHYRSLGTRSMRILARDTTPIDALHAMVRVRWLAHYERRDGRRADIEFDVVYLLQLRDGTPVVFAYVTGDEQQAYAEHGLTPE